MGLQGKVLAARWPAKGDFCGKQLEASPVSYRTNARWLQDECVAGHTLQQRWYCLWGNTLKKEGKTAAWHQQANWKYARETALQTPKYVKKGKRCYRHLRRHSLAVYGKTIVKKALPMWLMEVHGRGSCSGAVEYTQRSLWSCGKPRQEQVCWQVWSKLQTGQIFSSRVVCMCECFLRL